MKTVVIVSADGEWSVLRMLIPRPGVRHDKPWETFVAALGGREVTFVHGGWGKVSAAGSTQFVIDHLLPDLIVNIGTCGGLRGRIDLGTIVLAERTIIYDIVEQMTDADAATAAYSTQIDLDWLPKTFPSPVTRGLLLSADRDILAADIPHLVEKYDAVAADWESGAIAWVAKRNGQPLLILRGVSDLVGGTGGEAYGDYELFLRRTTEILRHLLEVLPEWLDAVEPVLLGAIAKSAS